jgi:YidC/Oxa1 family membrane protein insertase
MGEQKNLFLAIGLSIVIIVAFQFLFPQKAPITNNVNKSNEQIQPATSIDDNNSIVTQVIQSKKEIINLSQRVTISTPSLSGSINLKGAILDDLILSKYNEVLNDNSKKITLFSPDGTANPYYFELGWKQLSNEITIIDLPNLETQWTSSGSTLTTNKPTTLKWTNNQDITFKIIYEIDENYLFNISQIIENNGTKSIKVFPYRLIKRINLPKTINFFILHEGLISHLDDKLLEKKYDDLLDDCSSISSGKKIFCDQKSTGGWLGFTDKYWMATLIPDQNKSINANFRHGNNGRDNFRVGYVGEVVDIPGSSFNSYNGKLFAGAKNLNILSQYKNNGVPKFTDAIDWGWFSFLTKPISYAINWFYSYVGNFGLAIIAFTILMRLILFPLANTSFKSMAKMKKLQPDMQRLKETYPDDRQKMQQELMALYKKEGANPIAGCLPIIVQIPIFFSLYKVLFVTIEMYHAPFYGWIHDLSAPDPLGLLTIFGLISWDVPKALSIVNIGILPIFMGFTMWLQQKLNPAPADPTQAKIFAFLPFVFTFILAGFAAGLVLYWSVNNILSIAQQWFIQRKILAKNA